MISAISAAIFFAISGTAHAQDTNSITVTCASNAQDLCDASWIQGRRLDSVELPWKVQVSSGERVEMIAADGGRFELGFVPGEHQIILYPSPDLYFDSNEVWTSEKGNVEVLTPLPPPQFAIAFQWKNDCTVRGFSIPHEPEKVPEYAPMPGPGHWTVRGGFSTDSDESGPGTADDSEASCPEAVQRENVRNGRLPTGLEVLASKGWPVNNPAKVKVNPVPMAGEAGVFVTWTPGTPKPPPAPEAPHVPVISYERGEKEGNSGTWVLHDGVRQTFIPDGQDGDDGRPASDAGAGLRVAPVIVGGIFDNANWGNLEGGLHVAWTPGSNSNWFLLGSIHGGNAFGTPINRGTYGWEAGLGYWLTANRRLGLALGVQNQDIVNEQVEFVFKQVGGDVTLFYDLSIGRAGAIRFGGDFLFGKSMYENVEDDRLGAAVQGYVGWALPFN